jgi:hypothetical protein
LEHGFCSRSRFPHLRFKLLVSLNFSSFSANYGWLSSWEQLSHWRALILSFTSYTLFGNWSCFVAPSSYHPSEQSLILTHLLRLANPFLKGNNSDTLRHETHHQL